MKLEYYLTIKQFKASLTNFRRKKNPTKYILFVKLNKHGIFELSQSMFHFMHISAPNND